MSAEDYIHDPSGEMATGYLSPDDLKESLRDVRFGPRASRVAQGVLRQLKKLEEAIKQDNRFGDEPPVGSVVTFTKYLPGEFTYVALRTEAGWFLTGRHVNAKTWDWIIDFAGDAPLRLSHTSEWDEL